LRALGGGSNANESIWHAAHVKVRSEPNSWLSLGRYVILVFSSFHPPGVLHHSRITALSPCWWERGSIAEESPRPWQFGERRRSAIRSALFSHHELSGSQRNVLLSVLKRRRADPIFDRPLLKPTPKTKPILFRPRLRSHARKL